jgi:hypothetical protein
MSALQAVTDGDGKADEVLRNAMKLVKLTVLTKGE